MKARAKVLQDQGISIISMGAGEPDFETPSCIIDAVKRALDKGVNRYTGVRGTDELIAAMQLKFERDQKVRYEPTEVISTVGAKMAIAMAIEAVAGPGDEVIVIAPYWVSYPEQIKLAGATPVITSSTISSIKKAITPHTKAIIVNSPNNPTGEVLPESYLRELCDLLVGTGIWLISDEIYEHLVFDGRKHVSPASLSDDARSRTLIITGASKGYAMTGWRVGFAAGPQKLVAAIAKLQEQRYTCIAAVTQAAAAFALREPAELTAEIEKMRVSYQDRRDRLVQYLKNIPQIKCTAPQGTFYALLDFSEVMKDDETLASRLLTEAHVATV
ncbi:MAG: aminotransferase class I/II-fold pyridoxal phosphate-dependent enzyme, partial [Methylococcaceae bacterium]|nr:aminotransferase class I/II-fold pyridoxal phosphate-dependent enzyme [Methylococcaceae bacterium]